MAQKIVVELDIQGGAIANLDQIKEASERGGTSLAAMKKELREIQGQLLALEPGTEEFVKLSQEAGQVRDRMKDVAESINANAGPAIESLGNNFSLLTGKLANLDFGGAAESLKAIGGNIANISFKDLQAGVQGFIGTLGNLGKALLVNPIFLLSTTLAAIGVALKSALDNAKEATYEMAKATLAANEASKEASKSWEIEERRLRALGVAEDEITEKRNAANKSRLEAARAAARAQTALVAELEKQVQKSQGLISAGFSGTASLIYATQEELNAAREEQRKLTSELAELEVRELEAVAMRRKRTEEAKTANQKDELGNRLKNLKDSAEEQRRMDLEEDRKTLEEREKQRRAFAERVAALEEQIVKKGIEVERGGLMARQMGRMEEAEADRRAAEAKIELDRMVNEKRLELASGVLSSISALTDAFAGENEKSAERAFKINKAASIAQAIISTYQGANAIFASAAANPATVLFPAQPFIAAGIAIATGLANVAKISAAKFQGGAAGGGGGAARPSFGGAGGGGSTPAPFNPLNTQFINNRPPQVTPAYVLAGEVKSQTEARQKIEDRARL